jgi:eukaryotic-like serine/threonine-protein kinase
VSDFIGRPFTHICGAVPTSMTHRILRSHSRSFSKKIQQTAALADDLDRFIAARPIRARRAGPAKHLLRWTKRNPVIPRNGE